MTVLDTNKKSTFFSYYLCVLILLHMYLTELSEFCYTFLAVYYSVFAAAYCSLVTLGNNFFTYVQWCDIIIATCVYFIWYHYIIWACWHFNFAVIMDWFLLKTIEFIFTESMLFSSTLSWAAACSTSFMALALLLLNTTLKGPILLHSVYLFP